MHLILSRVLVDIITHIFPDAEYLQFLGCYSQSIDIVYVYVWMSTEVTPENCINTCYDWGYVYANIELDQVSRLND